MILDAGVASVMSAYNKSNGEYAGQNRYLLTDVLRGEWEFDGFVHSDWIMGVYQPYGAAAGLDVENPEPRVFGEKLVAAVEAGHIEPQVIDTAGRRILRTLYRFACAEDALPDYPMSLVACDAHRALALEAAEKSAVLLENDGILPFDRAKIRKLAVLGRLAGLANTGDNGSSRVRAPYVTTPLDGLRQALGDAAILTGDEHDLNAARAAADAADAIVVIAGYTATEEGEYIPGGLTLGTDGTERAAIGGDRIELGLPQDQIALIREASASGKPVVVVIVAGSAVLVESWRNQAAAIVQTFYAGMEGGTALARLLFGQVSPSGRLPFTVARDATHYPHFDRDTDRITYGYWHGYAKFEAENLKPRYPFGHGLSYSQFSYRALKARLQGGEIKVSVAVRNDGDRSAWHVVHCYSGFPGTVQPRAAKSLAAFARVFVEAGQTRIVHLTIAVATLAYRETNTHGWRTEPGAHRVIIAGSANDPDAIETAIWL